LGEKSDLKKVTVTDSKTRFFYTFGYTAVGVVLVATGIPFYFVPLFIASGIVTDVGLTPYMYRDRAWLYDCGGLQPGHTGMLFLDDPKNKKTDKYLSSLGCKKVGANPPWLSAANGQSRTGMTTPQATGRPSSIPPVSTKAKSFFLPEKGSTESTRVDAESTVTHRLNCNSIMVMIDAGVPSEMIISAAREAVLEAGTVACLKRNGQPGSLIDALRRHERR
jgi:hypothetical protein